MTKLEDPPRLSEDPAMGTILASADLDDDPEIAMRVGARLGFVVAPTAAPPPKPQSLIPPPGSSSATVIGSVALGTAVIVVAWWLGSASPPTAPPTTERRDDATSVAGDPNAEGVSAPTAASDVPESSPRAETTPEPLVAPPPAEPAAELGTTTVVGERREPTGAARTTAETLGSRSGETPRDPTASPGEDPSMATAPEAIRDARVEEQMQMIGAIQSAVLAARTEEALTLIQAYRAEFPSGLFHHECDVLERRALAHSE